MAEEFFGGFAKGFQGGMAIGVQRNAIQQRREDSERQERQFGQTFGLQQQQERRLQEHDDWLRRSTEASNRAKEKENDLKYFESGMQFLDRSKPYSDNSRKFGITRWLHGLGLPAGSQENKDLTGLLTKADDAELEVIRRTIATAAPHLSKEQLGDVAKSIARGDLTVKDAMEQLGKMGGAQAGAAAWNEGILPTGSPPAGGGAPSTTPPPGGATGVAPAGPAGVAPAALAGQQPMPDEEEEPKAGGLTATQWEEKAARLTGMNPPQLELAAKALQFAKQARESGKDHAPTQGRIATAKKLGDVKADNALPVRPDIGNLVGLKGLDRTPTVGEAKAAGIQIDLLTPDASRTLLERKSGAKEVVTRTAELVAQIDGRPELLGVTGKVLRGFEGFTSQVEGLMKITPMGDWAKKSVDEIAKQIGMDKWLTTTLAGESAIVKSRVIDLAYSVIKAQKSGRLSNQDIANALSQLGQSGSDQMVVTVLRDLAERTRSGFVNEMRDVAGIPAIDMMNKNELLKEIETITDAKSPQAEIVLRALLKQSSALKKLEDEELKKGQK